MHHCVGVWKVRDDCSMCMCVCVCGGGGGTVVDVITVSKLNITWPIINPRHTVVFWEICLCMCVSLDRQNPHLAFKTLQN